MTASPASLRTDRAVGTWLLVVCAFVIAMIVVGGATRLTDSGLSITEWDLAKGLTPPLTVERWAEEFALYQRTTEYQVQNRGMSLGEFQTIYWWEWGHRFLGKVIGLVFAVPFVVFLVQGRLKGRLAPILTLFALGGLQGAIGWWMVTSGLFGRLDVSPVRLAIHLSMAFAILALGLYLALAWLGWPKARSNLGAPCWLLPAFLATLGLQIVFGALLAGADGGKAYADWPTIGGDWIPDAAFPLNLSENHAAQHLTHRTLGYVVAILALVLAGLAARGGDGAGKSLALCLGAAALGQAVLGVLVVLNAAPAGLSLIHQAGAIGLWVMGWALARTMAVKA